MCLFDVFSLCERFLPSIDLLSAAVLFVESVRSGDVRLCGEHCSSDRRDHGSERVSDRANTVAEATPTREHPSALEVESTAVVGGAALHHLLDASDRQRARRYFLSIESL